MQSPLIHKVTSGTFVLVLFFICIACVNTQSVVDRGAPKWVGKTVDQFVSRNGQPLRTFEVKSGDIVSVWSSGTAFMPVPTTGTTTVYGSTIDTHMGGGGQVEVFCEIQIVTGRTGVIREMIILKDSLGLLSTSRCNEIL